MSIAIRDVLSREEMAALCRKSDLRGAWAILQVWLCIAATFALLAAYPTPLTFLLAVFILGGQQLACAVLTHEAAHYTLFKTRWMNEVVTDWLVARPIWTDVKRYRQHHMGHHAHTGTEDDPDMSLVRPFPGSRASLRRKLLRDLSGRSGLRRVIGLIGMDLGILKYTVAADVERLPQEGRTWRDYLRASLRNMGPVLIANGVLAAVLAALGALWVYSAWVVAYLTTFSLYVRIRSIAEHACTEGGPEVLNNTRTTHANWLARLTVAPFRVNYHVEHHLMASVPYYRLKDLHDKLRARGLVQPQPGYRHVLELASAG
ncbi:fatty acid desaturase family protein [Algiphilus aromaticivorans]|uniref:fatty acid desaturase family protein n=1 Tax=Algiphilus aromaticivorans TaxID=382454 RepID=UPI0005C1CB30|nr:fatty acid desaturase family protein [Algiphilus aromaticivorans]